MPTSIEALVGVLAPIIREYFVLGIESIDRRLKEIESRPLPINGKDGAPGENGLDGKDGAPGLDGKDGADGLNGKDGAPGADGKDGAPGENGIDGKDGADGLNGKDGAPGPQGEKGEPGLLGPMGPQGEKGIDGRDGLPGIAGRDGAPGEKGIDGKDGRDGLGLDDFDFTTPDDGRTLVLSLIRTGMEPIVRKCRNKFVIDRGVWEEGKFYLAGDQVSRGGSTSIAVVDTDKAPGQSKDWRLTVKRGADGKDGRDGKMGPQGPEGKPGRDLTQLGPDGKKW